MLSNDPVAVREAILAGTIQQVQAEPRQQPASGGAASERGALVGHSRSGAAVHRRSY